MDFAAKPELMAEFPYTLRSAVAFWVLHGLPHLADAGPTNAVVDGITAVVNPKTDSKADRRANFALAQNVSHPVSWTLSEAIVVALASVR